MAVRNSARKSVKVGTGKTVLKSYPESQTAAKLLVVSQPVLVSPLTSEPTCVALMRSVQPVPALLYMSSFGEIAQGPKGIGSSAKSSSRSGEVA